MKMKRNSFLSLLLSTLLSLFIAGGYLYDESILLPFNKKLTDTLFKIRGPLPASDDIVIVDIDEKSLRKLGQWPWPRIHMAKILENLSEAEAAVIGLDIVFFRTGQQFAQKSFRQIWSPRHESPRLRRDTGGDSRPNPHDSRIFFRFQRKK